jgi:hypothetical protein
MAFPVEQIPDNDRLSRHVPNKPKDFWVPEQNRPSSAAFKGVRDKLDRRFRTSVDWEKYKAAEQCKRSNSMAVVAVTAGQCRSIGKDVEHTPIWSESPNQAHADICDLTGNPMSNTQHSVASGRLAEMAVVVWPSDGKPVLDSQ